MVEKKPSRSSPRSFRPSQSFPESPRSRPPKIIVPRSRCRICPSSRSSRWTSPSRSSPRRRRSGSSPAAPVAVNLAHPRPHPWSTMTHTPAVRLGHPNQPLPNLHGPAVAGQPRGRDARNERRQHRQRPAAPRSSSAVAARRHHHQGQRRRRRRRHSARRSRWHWHRHAHWPAGQPRPGAPPPMPKPAAVASRPCSAAPKVIYKPKPDYTEEARQQHVEGVVTVHIRVLPNGSVRWSASPTVSAMAWTNPQCARPDPGHQDLSPPPMRPAIPSPGTASSMSPSNLRDKRCNRWSRCPVVHWSLFALGHRFTEFAE
jgi:protein TonB